MIGLCLMLVFGLVTGSLAHFGVIMPDQSMVMQGDSPNLRLTLSFCHHFEQKGMAMANPKAFTVQSGKDKIDLLKSLQETKVLYNQAWKTTYTLKKPGVYAYYCDPNLIGKVLKTNTSFTRPRPMWPPLW
jgi:cobalt/nickel transport protein